MSRALESRKVFPSPGDVFLFFFPPPFLVSTGIDVLVFYVRWRHPAPGPVLKDVLFVDFGPCLFCLLFRKHFMALIAMEFSWAGWALSPF